MSLTGKRVDELTALTTPLHDDLLYIMHDPADTKLHRKIEIGSLRDYFNVKDYGATGDGVMDDSPAFRNAYNAAWAVGGGTVVVPPGHYRVELVFDEVAPPEGNPRVSWKGAGTSATILQSVNAAQPVFKYTTKGNWAAPFTVRDVQFYGDGRTSDGFWMETGTSVGVHGALFENVSFHRCRYGFFNTGHIWYNFHHVTWERCKFGVYIKSDPDGHGANGQYVGCNWNLNTDAAMVLVGDGAVALQQPPRIIGGILEGCSGFGIAAINHAGGNWPIVLEGTHMEQNGPDVNDVIIEGVTYTQADQASIFANSGRIVLRDLPIRNGIRLIGSAQMRTENCMLRQGTGSGSYTITVEDSARVEHFHPLLFGYNHTVSDRELVVGGFADRHESTTSGTPDNGLKMTVRVPRGSTEVRNWLNQWTLGAMNRPFVADADPNSLTYEFRANPRPHHLRLTLPAGNDYGDGIAMFPAVNLTADRWYVWGFSAQTSGTTATLCLTGVGGTDLFAGCAVTARGGNPQQYVGLGMATATAASQMWLWSPDAQTFQISDMFLVEFSRKADALSYIRAAAAPPKGPSTFVKTIGSSNWTMAGDEPASDHFVLEGATASREVQFPRAEMGRGFTVFNNSGHNQTILVTGMAGDTATNGKYSIWTMSDTDCVKIYEQP